MASLKSICMSLFALTPLVAGHAAIIAAVGDAGGVGMALGIDTATPRDGTRRTPFQQDTTRFRGQAAKTVGQTIKSGTNKVEEGTKAVLDTTKDSLPQVTAGGALNMTLHQINQDGAGPFTCMINADAKATEWTEIKVATNVPGRNASTNIPCNRPPRLTSLWSLPSLPTKHAPEPQLVRTTCAWYGARTLAPSVVSCPSSWPAVLVLELGAATPTPLLLPRASSVPLPGDSSRSVPT
ncbi:hypothetical protein SMACR_03795 [Sordaria macrospora]|uniref:GEgh 16 protein n=1 Tax=Sordaria macrospora TaxID=5147 RepID=A0A8S9A0F5_SORMA|nr:hypothetical protein SMACR_03795 [Sordaria macrospora]WPJ61566.1 hypothetical protein SMAC4_03795 [Sordaria macrospora]